MKTMSQGVDEPLPEFAGRTIPMAADDYSRIAGKMDPGDDRGHSLQAVKLSQRTQAAGKLCRTFPPQK